MSICYPSDTDWGCAYTEAQLVEMRADPVKAAVMRRSEALAWYSLASLTAFQIGVCPTTIRPCAARCAPAGSWMEAPVGGASTAGLPRQSIGGVFTPYVTGGIWVNGCGCSPSSCSCSQLSEVILPGPVGGIESVVLDGEILDPSTYRVDNGNRLVSLVADRPWPGCQDMMANEGEGTFLVTYYRGAAPNEMTQFAAGILASEFYKSCTDGKCRLPIGVQKVVRGNAEYTINVALFEGGVTKIREVDAVINIYNPYKLKSAPRVLTPEAHTSGARTRTWGGY